jgi:hypothetical protein
LWAGPPQYFGQYRYDADVQVDDQDTSTFDVDPVSPGPVPPTSQFVGHEFDVAVSAERSKVADSRVLLLELQIRLGPETLRIAHIQPPRDCYVGSPG